MKDVLLFRETVESENFSIIFKELFLRWNTWIGTNETLSEWIVEDILQFSFEVVKWFSLLGKLIETKIFIEFSGVLITVIESDMFSINDNILTDNEIFDSNVLA